MSDTIVFDIETKNFFTDPDVGWNNFDALEISVVGVYSYASETYRAYGENEMARLAAAFKKASRIVGFGINRYDIPVLSRYMRIEGGAGDLWEKERVDLLSDIEMATGGRISLDKLAKANLGTGKTGHGAEAIALYRDGKLDELKAYCLKDVELTKLLYDKYLKDGELIVPDRFTGELAKVTLARHV